LEYFFTLKRVVGHGAFAVCFSLKTTLCSAL
jgi:hypothetical protein